MNSDTGHSLYLAFAASLWRSGHGSVSRRQPDSDSRKSVYSLSKMLFCERYRMHLEAAFSSETGEPCRSGNLWLVPRRAEKIFWRLLVCDGTANRTTSHRTRL